jgi:ATP-binding cassette, subfamily B (MDR/TAP), member 1
MSGERMYLAFFGVIFGVFSGVQASRMMPDIESAKQAARKIIGVIYTPSKIDPTKTGDKILSKSNPIEEIEFVDVWFRYPSDTSRWVFKGLNLKIEKNETVACVGESGAGKSTLVSLLLRFYDPQFGQILINGVPII